MENRAKSSRAQAANSHSDSEVRFASAKTCQTYFFLMALSSRPHGHQKNPINRAQTKPSMVVELALLACLSATRLIPSHPVRAELYEGDQAQFALAELVASAGYEVRLSYAASSPMRFDLRLSDLPPTATSSLAGIEGEGGGDKGFAAGGVAEAALARAAQLRRRLNVEKLLLGTDAQALPGEAGGNGSAGALLTVTARREGVAPEGEARARSSTVFEVHLERLVLGLALSVWRLVALLAVAVPTALCGLLPALQAALLAQLDEADVKASRRN